MIIFPPARSSKNSRGRIAVGALLAILSLQSYMCNSEDTSNPVDKVADGPVDSTYTAVAPISDIVKFLSECPTEDSAYFQIRTDFQIRRNGVLVEEIACAGPISSLDSSQYTDELILLQGLRTIYHMDGGKPGYLPWTSKRLYDWLRSKVGGFNIRDGAGSYCCENYDGRTFVVIRAQDAFNREFDKHWMGISGNIGLYIHEARHVDGFGHSSCCGITGGCDDTYDQKNLSPYATQWWLNKLWLAGEINVGMGCMSPQELQESTNWFLMACNDQFRSRFCLSKPPLLSMPAHPGGACP